MAVKLPNFSLPFIIFLISSFLLSIEAQSFLGVNYGQVADNLPPPEATVKLLKSTSISKVRLYGADPAMIQALANTGIGIVIGAANGDIPALATDPNHAGQWVASNVIPFYPASNIILITVGNEVITSGDQNLITQLVPAMQNIQNSLNGAQLGGKIKVSTVNSMAVLGQSDPPSSGAFNSSYGATMKSLLDFLKANGSPLTINPYPFFAYQSDPRPETLAFCLFQPNAGRVDSGTNIKYMNMFDAQKPDMNGMAEFLKPLNEVINKATALTEGKRSEFFNHQKSVADSLSALAWVAFTGKDCGMSMPIAHVEESWQMAEFYNNKVLIEYKNKDPNHAEWAKAMKEVYLPGLRDYVKTYYPLGPVWGTSGKATVSSAPKAAAPAPPPAPSAALFSSDSPKPSSSQPKKGMSAVFNEISAGGELTSGLRKVTDDMKTKNRADRSGVVPVAEKEPQVRSPAISKTGPPKLELQMGRKWAVENQIGKKDLVIDDCDSKQSVYVFGCKDSVLQIKGKVNNITIDKCTKMGILFQDVVAACEIVNCNSVQVQCQGSAPTISVDNTSGCQLYLSKDSLETSITTAKSSEVNVMVPASDADGDWGEHSLPQQYLHTFKDGQFVTTPVSHSGA